MKETGGAGGWGVRFRHTLAYIGVRARSGYDA